MAPRRRSHADGARSDEGLAIEMAADAVERLRGRRAYDLSLPLRSRAPVFPYHVPYTLALHRRHGETVRPSGGSFNNEVVIMSYHTGTHIDALGHYSQDGRLHGGCQAKDLESESGLLGLDATELPLYFQRGVLFDVPRLSGTNRLKAGEAVTETMLRDVARSQQVVVRPGTVVLVRTGWAQMWDTPRTYSGEEGGYPGIDLGAARWLVSQGASVVGADTPALEVSPSETSVHALLIVESGVPIIENLNLETLARHQVGEFLFVGIPLNLVGATASPLRPIAFG